RVLLQTLLEGTVHARHELSDQAVGVEGILLELIVDVRTRRHVIRDLELIVASVHRGVADRLTFSIILDFHLTDAGDIESIPIREAVRDKVNILPAHEIFLEDLLNLTVPELGTRQELRILSRMSTHF